MIVMMMAITPSLKASSLPLLITMLLMDHGHGDFQKSAEAFCGFIDQSFFVFAQSGDETGLHQHFFPFQSPPPTADKLSVKNDDVGKQGGIISGNIRLFDE